MAATEGFHDFKIERGGLVVFPQLTPDSNDRPRTTVIRSGVESLDRLLGGGLTWGTCTLLLWPAGFGKSTLAAQYVTATASESPAAVFLFDERRATFVDRCEALGMNIRSRLDSGHLTIEQASREKSHQASSRHGYGSGSTIAAVASSQASFVSKCAPRRLAPLSRRPLTRCVPRPTPKRSACG